MPAGQMMGDAPAMEDEGRRLADEAMARATQVGDIFAEARSRPPRPDGPVTHDHAGKFALDIMGGFCDCDGYMALRFRWKDAPVAFDPPADHTVEHFEDDGATVVRLADPDLVAIHFFSYKPMPEWMAKAAEGAEKVDVLSAAFDVSDISAFTQGDRVRLPSAGWPRVDFLDWKNDRPCRVTWSPDLPGCDLAAGSLNSGYGLVLLATCGRVASQLCPAGLPMNPTRYEVATRVHYDSGTIVRRCRHAFKPEPA